MCGCCRDRRRGGTGAPARPGRARQARARPPGQGAPGPPLPVVHPVPTESPCAGERSKASPARPRRSVCLVALAIARSVPDSNILGIPSPVPSAEAVRRRAVILPSNILGIPSPVPSARVSAYALPEHRLLGCAAGIGPCGCAASLLPYHPPPLLPSSLPSPLRPAPAQLSA